MDEQSLISILSGERRGVLPSVLRSACAVASFGYAAGVAIRNAAFDLGWRRIQRVPAPVISVGNLTTGGTGKTPVVAWLAQQLAQRGCRPAIVSRGYRSLDGVQNDEARVLARLCPAAVRVQNRERVAGARAALERDGCDAIVLDDGFQHRRLHRDLDIVLIDALQPWGYGRLLPRGLLREPVSAVRRSDLVVITRADLVSADHLAALRLELTRCGAPPRLATVRFRPQRLIRADGQTEPLSALDGRKIAAFCGIGNPRGFEETIAPWNPVAACRPFPDHHHYTPQDIADLEQWRQSIRADLLVTTLKDLVKWPQDEPSVRAIDIGVEFLTGQDRIEELLAGCIGRRISRKAA